MNQRILTVSYHFLLECIVGILILFLVFISKKELPPIGMFVVFCLTGMVAFTFLLLKAHEKGKWLYFITVFPLLILSGKLVEFPLFLGFLLGLFIYWRGLTLVDDPPDGSGVVLLLSFLLGLIAVVYAALGHYPFQPVIVYILLFQLLLALAGSFLRKWSSIAESKFKFAFYFFKIILAIALIGTAFTFSLKYIQNAFFSLLQFVVMILSKLAVPLLYVIQYFISLFDGKRKPPQFEGNSEMFGADGYKDQSYFITEEMIYFFLAAVAVIIIGYFIYKKKITLKAIIPGSTSVVEYSTGSFSSKPSSYGRQKHRAPEDPIRKEIFDLERFANKCKLARLPFETLDEWWERIGLAGNDEIIEIYEKVRYGGLIATAQEQLVLKKEIQSLKQQMKERQKMK